MYELKNLPVEPIAVNSNYVTKEEFNETLKNIQSMFDSLSGKTPAPSPEPPPQPEFKF